VGIFDASRVAIFSGLTVARSSHTLGGLHGSNKEPSPHLRRGRVVVQIGRSSVSTVEFGEVGDERR
jgi:hypothetical protein